MWDVGCAMWEDELSKLPGRTLASYVSHLTSDAIIRFVLWILDRRNLHSLILHLFVFNNVDELVHYLGQPHADPIP